MGRFTAVPWVLQNNRFSEQAESRAALPNYADGRIPPLGASAGYLRGCGDCGYFKYGNLGMRMDTLNML